MKAILIGAIFLFVPPMFASELEYLQLDPNQLVEGAGKASCQTCEQETAPGSQPFEKVTSFDTQPCLNEISHLTYKEFRVCESGGVTAGAFLYYQFVSGPGHQHVRDTSGYNKLSRSIVLNSYDRSLNGTFLTIQDADRSIRATHQMGSDIFLLPRKTVPVVKEIGNELHVTLQTGEQVVFDKTTRAILRGALTEGAFDPLKPSTVKYSGSGISIRMDLRTYDDPRRSGIDAVVTQGSKTCKVPRKKLFADTGVPLTTSDAGFVSAINSLCRGQMFSL